MRLDGLPCDGLCPTSKAISCLSILAHPKPGFGHGVRKVQSAGRNQAVIIHTATGRQRSTSTVEFLASLLRRSVQEHQSPLPKGDACCQWIEHRKCCVENVVGLKVPA